jgi:hypothetical protein
MKLIFRKELFLKDVANLIQDIDVLDILLSSWVDECDGKEVEIKIGNYLIHEDWCEIVEE